MIYPAISTCSDMIFVCLSPFSRWILWPFSGLIAFTKRKRRATELKEYEIHTTATYSTDGGTTEGSYFVEYATAKNMAEAKRILRAELKTFGYKNIKLDVIEA